MRKLLITGAGSFVGEAVQRYLEKWPEEFEIQVVGTRNGQWNEMDFFPYDSVFHVAGLAHADVGKAADAIKTKYYMVNTELAVNIAKKAKAEGVGQFIFMSSAIVYGESAPIGVEKVITKKTPVQASNFYGDSKIQAENGIRRLEDENFHVVILRCPMIYGKEGKGNFPVLERLALKMPLFPKVKNARSMLYVGNLAEFVRLMIENEETGIFWPCNQEWSNTSELVKMIAACHGKKTVLIPGFSWGLKLISHMTGYVNKAFGNMTYEEHLGDYKMNYRLYTLAESIKETEK